MSIKIRNRFTSEVIKEVEGDSLAGADLSESNLSEADLSGNNLTRANLFGTCLNEADLREANLYKADLSGSSLYEADLSGSNLYKANLSESELYGANLCGADLRGANLSGANLHFCRGVLAFYGEKHLLIYFKFEDIYYFKIGCITKTKDEWLKEFNDKGVKHSYRIETTRLYGDVIKLFSQYELLND